MMDTDAERLQSLAVDLDTRMAAVWLTALEPGSVMAGALAGNVKVQDAFGALLRYAYVRGYIDALQEERAGRRAELHRTHGYRPE